MQAAGEDDYGWFVGIDWATDAHEVCILTPTREPVTQRKVEHNGPAIASFIDQLTRLCEGKAARVAIAIEIPRGAVVESLVERGFHVYAINPKQLDRFRDRHTSPVPRTTDVTPSSWRTRCVLTGRASGRCASMIRSSSSCARCRASTTTWPKT